MGSNILPLEAFYYSLYAPFLPITRARHRFMCAHTPHAGSLFTLVSPPAPARRGSKIL